MRRLFLRLALPVALALSAAVVSPHMLAQQAAQTPALHAKTPKRLIIRNAMVIYGNTKPPYGPVDITIEDGLITRVGTAYDRANPGLMGTTGDAAKADAEIDATGKYVMPGIVNTHMHWHDERGNVPLPVQYERNLYLAAGVTTTREVGGDFTKSKQWQADSNAHKIIAPRILVYPFVSKGKTGRPDEIRAWIRDIKQKGADGLKIIGMDRDQLEAILDEARKQGLRTATHIAVEETTAKDYIELGVTSIEHFYGVADAAIDGIQNFPPDMNYGNEIHRFGRAGELYEQANPDRLSRIIDTMIQHGTAWSPTLSIYEASRDVIRAQNQPWFRDYLHPTLEQYFKPSLDNHGSYFLGWSSAQEAHWRRQYRIWMDALREFGIKGGLITTGDDAGFIYSMYGFGIARELELQEEAGFHPLEVIEHATWNGARLLGMGDKLGKIREGYMADLVIVNGNPLENLRLLNPAGADVVTVNGKRVVNYAVGPYDKPVVQHVAGIEWTIKDGIPYHAPTLMREVKEMVDKGRAERAGKGAK